MSESDQEYNYLMAAFASIDKDCDGFITKDELKISLKDSNVSDEDINQMIENADLNGDGKIDPMEFIKAYSN